MERGIMFTGGGAEAPAVTSAQMKEIEKRADAAGLSYEQMMENAGAGAAEYIASTYPVSGKRVLIFCGKGNNGGDGFVVARKLTQQEADVCLILTEGEPRTADAIKNRQLCRKMGIPALDLTEWNDGELAASTDLRDSGLASDTELRDSALASDIGAADLIVDAIYGTGFHGKLKEPVGKAARLINRSKATVYALDIPSGLNGDTGEADDDAVRADCTIVFHRLKPAHPDGKCGVYCGRIVCISIGIESVL